MMDKSAIEQIQQSQTAIAHQDALANQNLAYPVLAAHKDFEVRSLERFLPGKVRFTGTMLTSSVSDFSGFTLENKSDDSQCFINKDDASAQVIFNLGTTSKAGHGDFKAELKLEKTAEYKALLGVNDSQLSQKALAEFMEDWTHCITAFASDDDLIPTTKAIAAVRRLTIEANAKAEHEVQDFRSSRSAMENIEAKTDNGLPAYILFQCVPYNELKEFNFYARISVITGETPKLSFRIKRLEKIQDEIMDNFKELIVEKLDGKVPTYIGVFSDR